MFNQKILDDLAQRISQTIKSSPIADLEKNIKAMLQVVFNRLDLVTREEFEVQQQVLLRTREKLTQLETMVAQLEAQYGKPPSNNNSINLDNPIP